MKIIIPTTGKYFWELTPFFRLFNRFWGEDQEVIVLTERDPKLPFPNAVFARMDDAYLVDGVWTNDYYTMGIKWYLREHLEEPLVVMIQTDNWIRVPVRRDVVEAICEFMLRNDEAIRVGLTAAQSSGHTGQNAELKARFQEIEFYRCREKVPACFSIMSNLPAVWNAKHLCDVWGNYGGWASEIWGANRLMEEFPSLESLLVKPAAFEIFSCAGTRNKSVDTRLMPDEFEDDILPFVPLGFAIHGLKKNHQGTRRGRMNSHILLFQELRRKAVDCESLGDDHLDRLFNWGAENCWDPRNYYRFLFFLARELKPDVSVELGTESGRAAAHLAAGYPSGTVYGIDIVEEQAFAENVAPFKNVRFILGDSTSTEVLGRFQEGSVGLCFIDSRHTYAHIMKEIELWTPKMADGGVFVLDDLAWSEETKRVLWDLPFREKVFLADMQGTKAFHHPSVGFGCAVVRKR